MRSQLTPKELGTVEAVLMGFNKHQIPRLMAIKKHVDSGGVLDEFELTFLEETLEEVRGGEYFAEHHPEFKLLVAEVASLYDHITHKARENQQAG